MDISFNCDKCGQHIVIDEAGASQLVDCPKCGTVLKVPYKGFDDARRSVTPAAAATPPTPHPLPAPPLDKKCPFCAETIKAEAIVCRYCGRDLEPARKEHKRLGDSPRASGLKLANATIDSKQSSPTPAPSHTSEDQASGGAVAVAYVLALPATWVGFWAANTVIYAYPDCYVTGLFMPILSFFMGLYLLVRKEAGHGITCMAAAVVQAVIFLLTGLPSRYR